MKTKQLLCSIFALAIFSLLFSCDKDNGDTTPPVITLITPQNEQAYSARDTIHLEMDLSDNEGINSYKVEIHFADDIHSQTKAETTLFTFNKSWNVSGKQNIKIDHKEIVISANATPGEYHFIIYCADVAGNESYVVSDIVVQ